MILSYKLRFLTQAEYVELVNLYHLARSAGKQTKYDRMLYACKWFCKDHPAINQTSAYKDLSASLEGY